MAFKQETLSGSWILNFKQSPKLEILSHSLTTDARLEVKRSDWTNVDIEQLKCNDTFSCTNNQRDVAPVLFASIHRFLFWCFFTPLKFTIFINILV